MSGHIHHPREKQTHEGDVLTTRIPFSRPTLVGEELRFVADSVARAKLSGNGHYTVACQEEIRAVAGGGECLLTHSCTAALEMAAILLDLKPGDEVVMPSFTFVSTANAVVLRGATPVFVDVRPDTLNLDEERVAEALTERTRAIFAVHYAGVPVEMDALHRLAAGRGIEIVEDAAQAFGSAYHGRPAGSLAAMAAFSFHDTKNVISGEGGALVVQDPRFIERAHVIWEKGTNRRQFLQGQVDKYSWIDVGSSFLPSELVAAFLYGQLIQRDAILAARMDVWNFYLDALAGLAEYGMRMPVVPEHCRHNAHLFYVLAPSKAVRDEMIRLLMADDIVAPFHFVPLHQAPAGLRYGRTSGSLAHTEDLSGRLLRLPLFLGMADTRYRVVERLLYHARELARRR
jgi:dTDP-4-amino-4,6-dideoxygalactose transaminase